MFDMVDLATKNNVHTELKALLRELRQLKWMIAVKLVLIYSILLMLLMGWVEP
jgi:hypothetical protein